MHCLKCEHRFVGKFKGEPPSPGGLMKCLNCGHVMLFCDDLSLRELTEDEAQEIEEFRPLPTPFHPLTIVAILLAGASVIYFIFLAGAGVIYFFK